MTITAIILIITFAFFTHSLLGFGGGLISIPILCLFMPVQDVASMVMIYQFSMGLLIFKTYHLTTWPLIIRMIPLTIIGALLGVFLLKVLDGDLIRLLLAGYIIIYLAGKHTKFNLLARVIKWGGAHMSALFGGVLNAMIGGGAAAFIIYLRDKAANSSEFRANITMMLMVSNIPRAIGTVGTGMLTWDIFMTAMYGFPAFLIALVMGQKLHDKIPQKIFFTAVEILLFCSAMFLVLKVLL
tara:strand:- start:17 stop:739 length:723 start_codon:yes stop_codon:yes gene_type:complete